MNFRYFMGATAATVTLAAAIPAAAEEYTTAGGYLTPDSDVANLNPDIMVNPVIIHSYIFTGLVPQRYLLRAHFDYHVRNFSPGFRADFHFARNVDFSNGIALSGFPEDAAERKAILDEHIKFFTEELHGDSTTPAPALGSYMHHMLKEQYQQGGTRIDMAADGLSSLKVAVNLKYRHDGQDEVAFTDIINDIAATIVPETASDVDKVLAVHHYVAENFATKKQYASSDNNSPYDMYKTGEGESLSRSLFAHRLLEALGLEVYTIRGYVRSDLTYWNLVNVDGEWYNSIVDLARLEGGMYNDIIRTSYAYALLSDDALAQMLDDEYDNVRYKHYDTLPQATSTKYDALLKAPEADIFERNDTSHVSVHDNQLIYVEQPTAYGQDVVAFSKATMAPVTIPEIQSLAHAVGTNERIYFFTAEGFATYDIAHDRIIVLQKSNYDGVTYEDGVMSFHEKGDKTTQYSFPLHDAAHMNKLVDEQVKKDNAAKEVVLQKLSKLEPYSLTYRQDVEALKEAIDALPKTMPLPDDVTKQIDAHIYRAAMFYSDLIQYNPKDRIRILKQSDVTPITLNGNTDQVTITFSEALYAYSDASSTVRVYNDYATELEASAVADDDKLIVTVDEPFVKGFPYHMIVSDNVLSAKEKSIGHETSISFIVN